ncbi:hypothetical protein IUY40_15175 [Flavobacterium sp. ALJ2]|uniref:toxin-antitoxin system YwqK family antitoxin n=1 Tax=Flavobacterium sp. ALJ2 TaxID=2786960 RepID=UPI00189F4720|nr:hypothetical protein [Flavobacterium sp. ALJ2]MBF7092876.1 hypothetical protein [Flavobacterium sp. ALJ2]
MKIIKYIVLFVCVISFSCKTKSITLTLPATGCYIDKALIYLNNNYFKNPSTDLSGIIQTLVLKEEHMSDGSPENFNIYFGYRKGYVQNGKQVGLWQSFRYEQNDTLGQLKQNIFREEYFKNGLRDSIYKIYNKEGRIIYSTYFKNGNGIEKDFHENGKLYYEIEIKDGYFTDTLRIYNDKGNLIEKLLYKKDSLIYQKKI